MARTLTHTQDRARARARARVRTHTYVRIDVHINFFDIHLRSGKDNLHLRSRFANKYASYSILIIIIISLKDHRVSDIMSIILCNNLNLMTRLYNDPFLFINKRKMINR